MSTVSNPLRNPDYRLEKMDDEILLFNAQSQKVLYLNSSASIIWQCCDGERSIAEITRLITEAYPDAAASISADVESTIAEFINQGVIILV